MRKAMIMAAGVGSRLNPLTLTIPKPLVPIANVPLMDILLENLKKYGVAETIVNTHYMPEKIISRYKKNEYGIKFSAITEETLSGTAGGLGKCRYFFKEGENFFVMSGDGLSDINLDNLFETHLLSGAIATIVVKEVPKESVKNFGVVITDSDGFITEFQEKPNVEEAKSNLINTGIYVFNYKIFDYIPENEFCDFAKDVFPKLVEQRLIYTCKTDAYWSDIGTLEQYVQSNFDIFDGKLKINHPPISKSRLGKYITESYMPPCEYIDKVIVGKNCKIGKDVTLENTIICDNAIIDDGIILINCIVSPECRVSTNMTNQVISAEKSLTLV